MKIFSLLVLTLSSLMNFAFAEDGFSTTTRTDTWMSTFLDGSTTCTTTETLVQTIAACQTSSICSDITKLVDTTDQGNSGWHPWTTAGSGTPSPPTESVPPAPTNSPPPAPPVSSPTSASSSPMPPPVPSGPTGTSAETTATADTTSQDTVATTPTSASPLPSSGSGPGSFSMYTSTLTTVVPQFSSFSGSTISFDSTLTQVSVISTSGGISTASAPSPTNSVSESYGVFSSTLTTVVPQFVPDGQTTRSFDSTLTQVLNITVSDGTTLSSSSTFTSPATTSAISGSSTPTSSAIVSGSPVASETSSGSESLVPFTSTHTTIVVMTGDGTTSYSISLSTVSTNATLTTVSGTAYIIPPSIPSESTSAPGSASASETMVPWTTTSSVVVAVTTDGLTSFSTSVLTVTTSTALVSSNGTTYTVPPPGTVSSPENTSASPGASSVSSSSADSTSSANTTQEDSSQDSLAVTFTTKGLPTDIGDSTGLFTELAATFTIVPTEAYVTETGLDSRSSTITISHITTLLVPSVLGSTAPTISPPGATSYFTAPATTTAACSITDAWNPFIQTSSCSLSYVWTSTSRAYDPVCRGNACLCPVCTMPQKECLDNDVPTNGNCPKGWLCDVSQASGATTLAWNWPATKNHDLPRCATRWNEYITCITADSGESCSSVTYQTGLKTSTSTDSNGTVWAMPYRVWTCPDALCDERSFPVPFPTGWIKIMLNCIFKDHWSCITWFFHGFPPAPKIEFPPIGPPPDDGDLRPTPKSTRGPDGKTTPVTSPETPTSEPTTGTPSTQTESSSSSSCSEQTFTISEKICSTVTLANNASTEMCSVTSAETTGCSGLSGITTSTIPCSSAQHVSVFSECPLDSASSTITSAGACNTTTITWTGCGADTTTTAAACPISIDYNDPAIAATLSSWLSLFTFTLPATDVETWTYSTTDSGGRPIQTTATSTYLANESYTLTYTGTDGQLTTATSSRYPMPSLPSNSTPPDMLTTTDPGGRPPTNATTSAASTTTVSTNTDVPPEVSSSVWSWVTSDASAWSSYTSALASNASVSSSRSSVSSVASVSSVSSASSASAASRESSFDASFTSAVSSGIEEGASSAASRESSLSVSRASSESASQASATASASARSDAFYIPAKVGGDEITIKLGTHACAIDPKTDPSGIMGGEPFQWIKGNKGDISQIHAIEAVCQQLKTETFNPRKGWHYSFSNAEAPGLALSYNITFALGGHHALRCDPKVILGPDNCYCFKYDDGDKMRYCPPRDDGTFDSNFWDDDRCYHAFRKPIDDCYDKSGAYTTGGWFFDNGYIWSIVSHNYSPTFYYPLQGDGTEQLDLHASAADPDGSDASGLLASSGAFSNVSDDGYGIVPAARGNSTWVNGTRPRRRMET